MNRQNSLDQETVDVGSINSSKGRLDKIRKTRMGLLWILLVRKALGLMEIGPRQYNGKGLMCKYTDSEITKIPVRKHLWTSLWCAISRLIKFITKNSSVLKLP